MKSARLEWCLGETEAAKALLTDAIAKYSTSPKVSLM
jgi:hypothetical protein